MPPARLADSSRMRRSPPYLHQWIASNKLAKGEHLRTANGTPATVVGGSVPAVHDGWMWDLTVPGNNDHDFYVEPGATAVLVHNDNGTPGCSPAEPAAALQSAVEKRASEVIASQSTRVRGPVLSGAMDTQTDEIFFGQNTGIPDPLHPDLQALLDEFPGSGAPYNGIPGAHAEINALNQGLFARPGSQISDFIFYKVRLRGAAAGQYTAPCENCQWFIGGGG